VIAWGPKGDPVLGGAKFVTFGCESCKFTAVTHEFGYRMRRVVVTPTIAELCVNCEPNHIKDSNTGLYFCNLVWSLVAPKLTLQSHSLRVIALRVTFSWAWVCN